MLQLLRAFEAAKAGDGSTVVISGSAGLGKTSLVHGFLDRVGAGTVLIAACDDLMTPRALGPFRDMAHAEGLLSARLGPDFTREELFAALTEVLDRPAHPAVVVVEDVHWADDETVDVLRYLIRRIRTLPAVLVITMRQREMSQSHPARRLLTGPANSAPAELRLAPLSLSAVTELVRGRGLDAAEVHAVSGGNPFLVHQLLSCEPQDLDRCAHEALLARAERMSAGARSVLQMLAVLPDGADTIVARALFGDVQEELREAEGSGLLRSCADRIRFQHELGRVAVSSSMSFGERLAATNRVLDALVATGAEPMLMVRVAHTAGDGRRATKAALQTLYGASPPHSHREIWELSRIALECTLGLPARDVARLHLSAAGAGLATNHHVQAARHAEEAVDLLVADDAGPDEVASALLMLAQTMSAAGNHTRSATALSRARTLLTVDGPAHGGHRPVPSEDLVRCDTLMAVPVLVNGEVDAAMSMLTAVIEVAEANGWHEQLVFALGLRALAAGGTGTAAGAADIERAVELGAIHGPVERHAANLYALSVMHLRNAELGQAQHALDQAERFAREHALDSVASHCAVHRSRVLLAAGRSAEAETLLLRILAGTGDPGPVRTGAEATLARIWSRRGDERAGDLVERAWTAAEATGEIDLVAEAGAARLEFLWLAGKDEPVRQLARHLAALGKRHRHHRLRADALRMAMRVGESVEPFDGCPAPLAAVFRGDPRSAADQWERAGQPYEWALELVESTDASIAFEGLRLLHRTGASRTADLVRHRLRSRGFQGVPRGPRAAPDGSLPVLTDRQVEVLKLVASGHTNQEIADELFLARRTVDNHVSAILSRLEVDGRHEAAEEAVARGLVDLRDSVQRV